MRSILDSVKYISYRMELLNYVCSGKQSKSYKLNRLLHVATPLIKPNVWYKQLWENGVYTKLRVI